MGLSRNHRSTATSRPPTAVIVPTTNLTTTVLASQRDLPKTTRAAPPPAGKAAGIRPITNFPPDLCARPGAPAAVTPVSDTATAAANAVHNMGTPAMLYRHGLLPGSGPGTIERQRDRKRTLMISPTRCVARMPAFCRPVHLLRLGRGASQRSLVFPVCGHKMDPTRRGNAKSGCRTIARRC